MKLIISGNITFLVGNDDVQMIYFLSTDKPMYIMPMYVFKNSTEANNMNLITH